MPVAKLHVLAAVIEDALAAVGVPHGREPPGDLGDRGGPIDFLERAVRAAPKRVEHALTRPFW